MPKILSHLCCAAPAMYNTSDVLQPTLTPETPAPILSVRSATRLPPAWEMPRPTPPLPPAQASSSSALIALPVDVLTELMSRLPFPDALGLAGTCRYVRLASRNPAIWSVERLARVSSYALETLPADIQQLPTVRAVRYATQVRERL